MPTLRQFEHVAATSLSEAVRLSARRGRKAAVIAGGTDLLGVLKDGIHPGCPEVLVDIKPIAALRGVIIQSFGRDGFINAHGLTVELTRRVPGYHPAIVTPYSDIPFARDSGWADFVKWTDSVRAASQNKR